MPSFLIFLIVFFLVRNYARKIGAWSALVSFLFIISGIAYSLNNIGAAILFGVIAFFLADRRQDQNRYGVD